MGTTYNLIDSDSYLYDCVSTIQNYSGKVILPRSIYVKEVGFKVVDHYDPAFAVSLVQFFPPNLSYASFFGYYINGSDFAQEVQNYLDRIFIPNLYVYNSNHECAYLNTDISSFTLDNSEFDIFGLPSGENDFYTDLYPDLLVNTEQAIMAQNFLIDDDPMKELDPDYWTDKNLKFFEFVEKYNNNVLLLRSTRKVNIENTVSTASTSSSSVNLSGVENKLQNINNSLNSIKDNLQYTDAEDTTKGLAEITSENNSSKSVVVETIEKAPFNPYLDDDNNDIYGV